MTLTDGTQLTGTLKHPVWAPDDHDWRGLGDFQAGQRVRTRDGVEVIASVKRLSESASVYNIEVAGEHVYQVTDLGILVQNGAGWDCSEFLDLRQKALAALKGGPQLQGKEFDRYEELLNAVKNNFRGLMNPEDLKQLIDSQPLDQITHLHHILPKLGISGQTSETILALQKTLWTKYGIDPFTSLEIFVHAPYAGVHSVEAQMRVIEALEKLFAKNPTKKDVLDELRSLGGWAAKGGINGN